MVRRNGKEINTENDRKDFTQKFLKILKSFCDELEAIGRSGQQKDKKLKDLIKMAKNVNNVLKQYEKDGRISKEGGKIIDRLLNNIVE
jgi:thiamine pyrophosphokinase